MNKQKFDIVKTLFNSLGIVVFIKTIYKYHSIINVILIPFYVFYGMLWIALLLSSFLFWKMPTHIPVPFIGNSIGDRFLLLIGAVSGIAYYFEEFKNR